MEVQLKPSKNEIMNQQFFSEKMFADKLVNNIVFMFATIGSIAFVLTQLRVSEIGWTVRDIIYLIIVITIISTALAHRKLATQFKAMSVIILSLTVGVTGIYTLGMLGGAIFFFPLAAVIMALLYSKRTVLVFGVLSMFFLCFIAMGLYIELFICQPRFRLFAEQFFALGCLYYMFFFLFFDYSHDNPQLS